MLHTEAKLEQRILELKGYRFEGDDFRGYRYRDMREFGEFRVKEDHSGLVNPPMPVWEENDGWMQPGDQWKGRDRYLWLEKKITLPQEWKSLDAGLEPVGVFDFGLTGGGYNSGFEAMLYIDGEVYQAVDSNHMEVLFKEEHFGRELTLTFRLWSGLEGGGVPRELVHCYKEAYIALLDSATDDLYYLSDMMLDAVKILSKDSTEHYELLEALDEAYLLIDWTEPGSDRFYQTIQKADAALNESIDSMDKNSKVLISCVGHTHIDTAWLWRLKHTREKASRSFSSVLRLMERFPEYYFLHTQPQQYAYIKEDFPEIYAQIQEKVKEGRWEIDGGMWVEADCNIPSGESLTRQFLQGRKFMLEEFGKEPEYLWLPDVFGYSWALPQILKKSGIHTFMTTKISWNQYNHLPNDTFWWKGIDGSTVLTHMMTTPDPGQAKERYYATYNGILTAETVQRTWEKYQDKKLNKDLLLAYGYGDGGGGVNREMLERRRRLDKIPGIPSVKTTKAGDYFRKLQETVTNTKQPMATWDGEMYLEFHRGTYTSQGYNKKMNRRMEELYRKAEWMTVMKALAEGSLEKAEQEELTEGWKIILTHQFHDIIPGSSIHEVYEDSVVNYEEAKSIADEVIKHFYEETLRPCEEVISIVNAAGEDRSGLVWLPDRQISELYAENGMPVAVQVEANGTWIYAEDVPAMGAKYLHIKEEKAEDLQGYIGTGAIAYQEDTRVCAQIIQSEDSADDNMQIETPYYKLTLNSDGQIAELYDKEYKCQVLAEGARGNVLQLFEDKPLNFDAWDIDMYYYQKMEEITGPTKQEVIENGTLRTVIRQEWQFHQSCITQDMILYAKDRRIDFKTHVDWQETQKLLKAAFPVDIRTTYATYDVQYGNVRRPNNSNTSWDRARFETVAHRWVDLSEHDYGVSLLNDCKYGHDIHDNVMRISLLKAATYPDHAADKGEHDFTYSLLSHKGDFVEGKTVQEAFDLNQPMEVAEGILRMPTEAGKGIVHLEGAHVELDALKKSEDGQYLVLRFHEYAGAKGKVFVDTGFQVKAYAESDLMERPQEEFKQGEIRLTVKPYEIKTLLIKV